MTIQLEHVDGTISDGTTVVLTPIGSNVVGKASYVTPAHSRLAQRQIDFLVTQARTTPTDPGVARGGLKVTFGDRQSSESCCTVQQGSVIIDVGVRWSLNQPETLADDAIAYLQALVFTPEFIQVVKRGVLPN